MGVVKLHSPLMKSYVELHGIEWSMMWIAVISSYLASRHELQRSECRLHVWDVGFQVVEGIGDAGFQL